jgi:hypothetical protein
MTELFDIEPTAPKWRKLAEIHGIKSGAAKVMKREGGATYYEDLFVASISWFGTVESDSGETEKEAVITLIHRLKLTGWETVSL